MLTLKFKYAADLIDDTYSKVYISQGWLHLNWGPDYYIVAFNDIRKEWESYFTAENTSPFTAKTKKECIAKCKEHFAKMQTELEVRVWRKKRNERF